MATNYLHGSETIEVEDGAHLVKTAKSAIIGLIGTAPMENVSTLIQCLSERDAATFGDQFTGFTIPQALDAIYGHGAGIVLIISVLDPAKHKTAIEDEVAIFDRSTERARLAHSVVANVVVKNNEGSTTRTASTDYRVDTQAGVLTNLGKTIEAGGNVKVSYEYADPSKVTAAGIIGRVSNAGNRTDVKLLNDSSNLYGYFAKILIAPVFYIQRSVAAELIAMAEKLGVITCIGAPVGTTFAQALAGRGPGGTINFNINSDHVRLCYPHVKVYDLVTNTERPEPLSQCTAGLRARVGLDKSYWWSSSNQEILGVTGVERQLSAMIDDLQGEVSLLNEQGITTILSSYGSNPRLQDNRAAAWPAVTHMRNFESVRRTSDVVNESIYYFSQQYIDVPVTQALIDTLAESVNAYGRKMTGGGAVLGFRCWFDPTHNPGTELAAGYPLLSYKYTPPPPLKRLTFEAEITSEYPLTLKGGD